MKAPGLPWWSRGEDSTLPIKEGRVPLLVKKVKSHMPVSPEKNKSGTSLSRDCEVGQLESDFRGHGTPRGRQWSGNQRWTWQSDLS